MVYSINMDYPGYNTEQEITDVCDLIARHGFTDILEFGSFGGRMTHTICSAFPDSSVTAVELIGAGIDLSQILANVGRPTLPAPIAGSQYSNLTMTEEWFRATHAFPNLSFFNTELRFYRPEVMRLFPETLHDLVIVNLIPEPSQTFETFYDRALSFGPKMVIGMVRHHYPTYQDPVLQGYDCDLLSNTLIRFNTKR